MGSGFGVFLIVVLSKWIHGYMLKISFHISIAMTGCSINWHKSRGRNSTLAGRFDQKNKRGWMFLLLSNLMFGKQALLNVVNCLTSKSGEYQEFVLTCFSLVTSIKVGEQSQSFFICMPKPYGFLLHAVSCDELLQDRGRAHRISLRRCA